MCDWPSTCHRCIAVPYSLMRPRRTQLPAPHCLQTIVRSATGIATSTTIQAVLSGTARTFVDDSDRIWIVQVCLRQRHESFRSRQAHGFVYCGWSLTPRVIDTLHAQKVARSNVSPSLRALQQCFTVLSLLFG